jgi:hypothetical protein
MTPDHPDYPLFRSFVDGQLTEPFYARYVRFLARSESDLSTLLTDLGGTLTGTETRLLRESGRPEGREGFAHSVRQMSRPERAALAELVLTDEPADQDRPR